MRDELGYLRAVRRLRFRHGLSVMMVVSLLTHGTRVSIGLQLFLEASRRDLGQTVHCGFLHNVRRQWRRRHVHSMHVLISVAAIAKQEQHKHEEQYDCAGRACNDYAYFRVA